ncbi:hypothetical protein G9A89_001648 [Geosiphon pyriformis]|nr:hypothetical protein G9A89_001648 [Geosiphon pyriformis]
MFKDKLYLELQIFQHTIFGINAATIQQSYSVNTTNGTKSASNSFGNVVAGGVRKTNVTDYLGFITVVQNNTEISNFRDKMGEFHYYISASCHSEKPRIPVTSCTRTFTWEFERIICLSVSNVNPKSIQISLNLRFVNTIAGTTTSSVNYKSPTTTSQYIADPIFTGDENPDSVTTVTQTIHINPKALNHLNATTFFKCLMLPITKAKAIDESLPSYHPILENAFGLAGLILWSLELLIQGFSPFMLLLWITGVIFMGSYGIVLKWSIPLIAQPEFFALFSLFCYTQYLYYDRRPCLSEPEETPYHIDDDNQKSQNTPEILSINFENELAEPTTTIKVIQTTTSKSSNKINDSKSHSRWINHGVRCIAIFLFLTGLFIMLQLATVLAIKVANSKNISWPETTIGILPICLTLLGYIPQFYEIYREKKVQGISLIFLSCDATGALFGMISLFFRAGSYDFISASIFASVFVCDSTIIFLSPLLNWWNSRMWRFSEI